MSNVTSISPVSSQDQDARDAQTFRRLRESIMGGRALQFGEAYLRVQIIGETPCRADFDAMVAMLPPTREERAAAALDASKAA